jgi:alginate O-acetyltransferase complex protein AlgI
MPFHSPAFVLLCLATLAVYYVRSTERAQHAVLLAASVCFYAYAGAGDLALVLAVIVGNHWLAIGVGRRKEPAWLVASIVANLGVLAVFKYRAMLAAGVEALGGISVAPLLRTVVLPLGISFYIFQLISYQVDLHRGSIEREPTLRRLLLYVLFFPHHQAGPIMRPADFLPQFVGPKRVDGDAMARGGMWILLGLTKKVVADAIAPDAVFANVAAIATAASAWRATLTYTAQIYCDFSGYSDIALGLGALFGYALDRNFAEPYLASNPSEFWRRWHITLSRWFAHYVYEPLGGRRRGPRRAALNAVVTMLASGLWHGASLRFVVWGALHAALLLISRLIPGVFRVRVLGWALTFGGTVVAWVAFRAHSWGDAVLLWRTMFRARDVGAPREWARVLIVAGLLLGAHAVEHAVLRDAESRGRAEVRWRRVPPSLRGLALGVAISLVLALVADKTTYIYFRF